MEAKYLLALNAHPKIGSQTIRKALAVFGDNPERLWHANSKELLDVLEPKIAEVIIEAKNNFSPENEIAKLNKLDIGYLTFFDKDYPKILKEAHDSPIVLYARGDLSALSQISVAVVGSRKFTSYGRRVTATLVKNLTEEGLCIVSGLALGIDTVAHQVALETGGITVGVLGCGLDRIYPVANYGLAKEIINQRGAIVSEFPPGTPPLKYNFPARNRIIAGLSVGTIVVEAALESGALITAYQALEYNREVFAVPGNIDSPMSEGTNSLIKKGASLVADANDVLEQINFQSKKSEKKSMEVLPSSLEEEKIMDVLKTDAKFIDEIIAETRFPITKINTVLTMMEMKGMVINSGGGRYCRK